MRFQRHAVQLEKLGDYRWGVVSGLRAGDADTIGSLYWLRYLSPDTNEVRVLGDPLAASYPFGVHAPAEVYDLEGLQQRRADLSYYEAMAAELAAQPVEDHGGVPSVLWDPCARQHPPAACAHRLPERLPLRAHRPVPGAGRQSARRGAPSPPPRPI